jgi:predicted transcriptional regulator
MSRKVFIKGTFEINMVVEEGVDISEVISHMNWNFTPDSKHADSVDIYGSGIGDYEIVDSK